MKFGFVYLWYDTIRKKYYLGSHLGLPTDGYTGSNRRFQSSFKSRPFSFKRRILESYENISSKELLQKEQFWLNMIKPEELGIRYYNEKKVAAGGDIISNLSEEKKKQHAEKSKLASKKYWKNISKEDYENRRKTAFGENKFDRSYMKNRQDKLFAKQAKITFPSGEEKIIRNIRDFCKEHNLNYGNFKTMLRGEKYKSCGGFKGIYI
jgi:hypothetical protein